MKKKILPLLVLGVIVFLLAVFSSFLFPHQGMITNVSIAILGILGILFINRDKFRSH